MMDISARITQLEAGGWRLGVKNILRLLHPDKEISYLTKICKMKIDVCDSWSIQKSCQHDGMIMTIFNNIGISGYKQFNLYASRIYLQLAYVQKFWIALGFRIDIQNGNGRSNRNVLIHRKRIGRKPFSRI